MRALAARFAFLLALLFLASAAPVAAQGAPAVDGISARAVDASGKSIGRAYFVERRNAGSKFVGHIAISNSGKTFARLYVDAVDAVTSNRGGTVFAPRDAPDKSVGAWITPSKKLIRLDPGDEKIVAFTVDIPEDAYPGDHVGGVAIEPLRRKTTGGQFAVTQVLRVAIATQIRVRGPVQRNMQPKVLRLEAVRGSQIPALFIRLDNKGDLLCRPTLTATLYKDEKLLSSEKRDVDTILSRTAIDYPLYWSNGLKKGKYQAAVRTEGCGKAVETQADVELKDDLSGTTAPATTGVVPEPEGEDLPTWAQIALAALIALVLLGLGFWLAKRSGRDYDDDDDRRDRDHEADLARRERELELQRREQELARREAELRGQAGTGGPVVPPPAGGTQPPDPPKSPPKDVF